MLYKYIIGGGLIVISTFLSAYDYIPFQLWMIDPVLEKHLLKFNPRTTNYTAEPVVAMFLNPFTRCFKGEPDDINETGEAAIELQQQGIALEQQGDDPEQSVSASSEAQVGPEYLHDDSLIQVIAMLIHQGHYRAIVQSITRLLRSSNQPPNYLWPPTLGHNSIISQIQAILGIQIVGFVLPVASYQSVPLYAEAHFQAWVSLGPAEQMAGSLVSSLHDHNYLGSAQSAEMLHSMLQHECASLQAHSQGEGSINNEVSTAGNSWQSMSVDHLADILGCLGGSDHDLIQIIGELIRRQEFRVLARVLENIISDGRFAKKDISLISLLNSFGLRIASSHFPNDIDSYSLLEFYFRALAQLVPAQELAHSLFYFFKFKGILFFPYKCAPLDPPPYRKPPSDQDDQSGDRVIRA